MKFSSHLFLRWFTWQNNKQQISIYYSQHCQPSFAKAIIWVCKHSLPFPSSTESCPAVQHLPPHAACSGLGEDPRNSFSSARPNMWTGQSQERLTCPSVSFHSLSWAGQSCAALPWHTKHEQHPGLKLQLWQGRKSEIRGSQTWLWNEQLEVLLHLKTPGLLCKGITQVM